MVVESWGYQFASEDRGTLYKIIRPIPSGLVNRGMSDSAAAAAKVPLTIAGDFGLALGKIIGLRQRLLKLCGITARQPRHRALREAGQNGMRLCIQL